MSQSPPDNSDPASESPDDARIGRAFKRSLVLWVAIAVSIAGVVWWVRTVERGTLDSNSSQPSAPTSPPNFLAEIPNATFTDITPASGIDFVHENGAYGDKLLPETMGGGVAFFDFDSDGDQDLLFINSTLWPWKTGGAGRGQRAEGRTSPLPPLTTHLNPTMGLYRNDGRGHFENATADSGLDVSFYGMGVAVGDYDNDGSSDVFITGVGGNRLFRNLGAGRFEDVTATAGVAGSTSDWSTSAGWLDHDNDGDLDLFVCHYVRWSKAIDLEGGYKFDGVTRAYGPPMNFEGTFPSLYRNDGQGRFADVSVSSGIQVTNPATARPMAKSLAVAPVDVDNDGWIDLVVANDTVQNFLFRNLRNGTFQEIGSRSGIAFDAYGVARGAMGIDAARFRNDDALGIAIGNFANEMNALYVSGRDALMFADEAVTEGVGPASRLLLKFGLFFFDYDLDGRLDVLTANGHLDEDIAGRGQRAEPLPSHLSPLTSIGYRQPAQLFWNRGRGRAEGRGQNLSPPISPLSPQFVPVPPEKCGKDIFKPIVGRGSAFADIDGDGDLDVVMTQIGGPPLLLRNDQRLNHHWLRIKLVGTKSNRDGIGAWVRVRVGNAYGGSVTLARQVMPTKSYLSQSEAPVTFGLSSASRVEEVTVTWPGGSVQRVSGLKIDASNLVKQP